VEDMGIARASLKSLLTRSGFTVTGSAPSAEKAWLELKENPVDLIILDYNLKGAKSGLWLAQKINESLGVPFIFLTAYGSEELLEKMYSVNPAGYIMKPYNNPTLLATIKLAIRKISNTDLDSIKTTSIIKIKSRNKGVVSIDMEQINHIMSEGNYIAYMTEDGSYTQRGKLSDTLEILPKSFFRIHRRYVVNADKVTGILKDHVILLNGELIPTTYSYDTELMIDFLEIDKAAK